MEPLFNWIKTNPTIELILPIENKQKVKSIITWPAL